MHLPKAYRSLPRPSSPLSAKASAIRPYFALKILKSANTILYKKKIMQLKKRILLILYLVSFAFDLSLLLNLNYFRIKKLLSNMSKNLFPDLKISRSDDCSSSLNTIFKRWRSDGYRLELLAGLEPYICFHSFIILSLLFLPPILTKEEKKWRISESNRWPPACKAGALASWANPPGNDIWTNNLRTWY